MTTSFTAQVEAFVLGRGQCTIKDVSAALAHTLTAARAAALGRSKGELNRPLLKRRVHPYSAGELVALGVYSKARRVLGELVTAGRLRKVRPGVYAPPTPQLYQPGETG